MLDESFNFSFSGLKTAVMREFHKVAPCDPARCDLAENTKVSFAYEIQESITDVLVEKTIRAAKLHNAKSILLSGGVAANSRLREKFQLAISHQSSAISFFAPPKELCTDNAVTIAAAAYFLGSFTLSFEGPTPWHTITAEPSLSVEI